VTGIGGAEIKGLELFAFKTVNLGRVGQSESLIASRTDNQFIGRLDGEIALFRWRQMNIVNIH